MRERIYEILSVAKKGDKESKFYDYFITIVTILSLIPLTYKGTPPIYIRQLDTVMVYFLFLDYVMRWIVNDYTKKEPGKIWPFITYPISLWAICDLLAILPSLNLVPKAYRILRILRVTKVLRYSKSFIFISNVFKKEKRTLLSVLAIAITYLFISALLMFCYEPDTFTDFFEALYWATTALTTVGYGDIYPVSYLGRLISMISSLFGIAIIALPAGVVTAGFMEEINKNNKMIEEQMKQEGEKHGDTK